MGRDFFFKIPIGRTVFNFSCKISFFSFRLKRIPQVLGVGFFFQNPHMWDDFQFFMQNLRFFEGLGGFFGKLFSHFFFFFSWKFSFLRGCMFFLSKKRHFFQAKLQFLRGWVLFLSKKWPFFEIFKKMSRAGLWAREARSASKPRALNGKCNTAYIQVFIGERHVRKAGSKSLFQSSLANAWSARALTNRNAKAVERSRCSKACGVTASFALCCWPPTPLVVKVSEVKWNEWVITFWVLYFFGTFICYRECLNLSCYISKKVQKNFLMGLKIWWSWGSRFFFSKSP